MGFLLHGFNQVVQQADAGPVDAGQLLDIEFVAGARIVQEQGNRAAHHRRTSATDFQAATAGRNRFSSCRAHAGIRVPATDHAFQLACGQANCIGQAVDQQFAVHTLRNLPDQRFRELGEPRLAVDRGHVDLACQLTDQEI